VIGASVSVIDASVSVIGASVSVIDANATLKRCAPVQPAMTDETTVGDADSGDAGFGDEGSSRADSGEGAETITVDPDEILARVDGPILLFDGVCNLCNQTVRFVVDNDSDGQVSFAPQQSPVGEALLDRFDLPRMDSVVLIEGERVSRKSDAVLRLARYLDAPLPAASLFELVPGPLREIAYDTVAEHRYRVFGRKDECPVPDPETRERFLDGSFA